MQTGSAPLTIEGAKTRLDALPPPTLRTLQWWEFTEATAAMSPHGNDLTHASPLVETETNRDPRSARPLRSAQKPIESPPRTKSGADNEGLSPEPVMHEAGATQLPIDARGTDYVEPILETQEYEPATVLLIEAKAALAVETGATDLPAQRTVELSAQSSHDESTSASPTEFIEDEANAIFVDPSGASQSLQAAAHTREPDNRTTGVTDIVEVESPPAVLTDPDLAGQKPTKGPAGPQAVEPAALPDTLGLKDALAAVSADLGPAAGSKRPGGAGANGPGTGRTAGVAAIRSPRDLAIALAGLAPMLVSLMLGGLIAIEVAHASFSFLGGRPLEPPAPARNDRTKPRIDVNGIIAAHLFGEADADPSTQGARYAQAPANLLLAGTLAMNDSKLGLALISNDGNTLAYRVGDKVTDTVLNAVYRDHVELKRGNRMVLLTFPKSPLGADGLAQGPILSTPATAAQNLPPHTTQNEVLADADMPKAKAGDVLRGTAATSADGRLRGFRVAPSKDAQGFSDAGLHPGDIVVAVNGTSIENQDRKTGQDIFDSMRSLSQATITVLDHAGMRRDVTINPSQSNPSQSEGNTD
jgi:general secretion pathway protein C